jgi:peptidoglycan/LPS O-acetylase OafA/YrhL
MRSLWIGLLQFAGAVGIIVSHSGFFTSFVGHIAVELFFVLSGANMVKGLQRSEGCLGYAISRAKRFAPEVSVVWGVCLILVIAGWTRPELILFLCSAPLFLENFLEPFLDYSTGINWTFISALWFVATLLQLQVFVFAFRRLLFRYGASTVFWWTLAWGTSWRIGFAATHGSLTSNPDFAFASNLFRMPFTHIESVVFGFLLGRGLLRKLGEYQPVILVLAVCAAGANLVLGNGQFPLGSLGFPDGLAFNYQYLWGYPLLALACASLCAPNGFLARTFNQLTVVSPIERTIRNLAPLTYGVYVFHGMVMAAIDLFLLNRKMPLHSTFSLLITAIVSFAVAAMFRRIKVYFGNLPGFPLWERVHSLRPTANERRNPREFPRVTVKHQR